MDSKLPLHSEIEDRLGVLPNFFRLAPDAPEIGTNLWGFAKFGYLDNPLPALFKERLFVSLSRFCAVRYCITRHVGFLVGLGHPSGDAHVRPETAEQVVSLLSRALPEGDELNSAAMLLTASGVTAEQVPEPGTPIEAAVFDCATHVFLQTPSAETCLEALARFFEPKIYQHLLVFLTFVRTAHFWTVVHPELKVERDMTELLSVQDALLKCVIAAPEQPTNDALRSLAEERKTLQRERQLRSELEESNAKLREERELLRVTFASIGDAVLTTDTVGMVTNMNAVAERLTGWTKEEAVGLPLDQVFHILEEGSRETVDNPAMRALREGAIQSLANHTLLIAKDGTEVPIDDSAAPIRDEDQRILGAVLIFRDVTERRAKQEVSELLAAIVESSDDAIISKNLEGVIQSWNAGAERLFGYTAEEAIGRSITMLIPPEHAEDEASIIERITRGERIVNFDTVRLRRDGQRVEVSLTISPVNDARGRVIGASKVVHDISERRKLEATVAQAALELAESDRRKENFLAILAHELRNPLAPMRSCIEVLKAGASSGDQEPLGIMERQVNQMVRLIDDLLDIARVSRGQLELRKGRVELQRLIDHAIEAVQPMIEQKEVKMAVEVPSATVEMHADDARLTQVITNLLTNAVKFSNAGGTITLRAQVDAKLVQVSVTDEGAGIPEDKLEKIFEMFARIEVPAHEVQGLGIGLTMAKELVELHGGELSAHSAGPGQGATFTFKLPLTSPAASKPNAPRAERPEPPKKVPLKVLVVDDSSDSALALALLLNLRGCTVQTAFDGESGIQLAEEFLPTLVFLDIGMPGMSGLEVAEHLRRHAWGQHMMIVALSGWGQAADREKTKRAGFDKHLIKPAELEAIDGILSEAWKLLAR